MKNERIIVVFLACLMGLFACGCGADYQDVKKASEQEVATIKDLRAIFDKHNGDETQFTPEETKQFMDWAHGDKAKVENLIAFMKNPRGGGVAATNRPFQMGEHGEVMPPGAGR